MGAQMNEDRFGVVSVSLTVAQISAATSAE